MDLKKCIVVLLTVGHGCCLVNFIFSNYSTCENKPFRIAARFRLLNETYQLIDADYVSSINLDDNLRFKLVVYYMTSKRSTRIFDLNEDGACKVIEKYIGDLLFDLLIAAGVKSRKCPVSKGTYHLRNYHMNFRKLKLQAFPTGMLRFNFKLLQKPSDKLMGCMNADAQNKPM